MAVFKERVPENVEGRYYVDISCTACSVCIDTAPENFAFSALSNSYVKKQPENEREESLCQEAVQSCPHEAIGEDGAKYDWSAIPSYDTSKAEEDYRRWSEEQEKQKQRKRWWQVW